MQVPSLLKRCAATVAASAMLIVPATMGHAQGLPAYMQPIEGVTTTSPADVATNNILALNNTMFELYDAAAKIFQNAPHFHHIRSRAEDCGRGRWSATFWP